MSRTAFAAADPAELPEQAPRLPTRPMFIHTIGSQAQADSFDHLDHLVAHVRRLSGKAEGLRISERAWPCAYPGLDVFFAFSVYAIDLDGSESWLGSAAGPRLGRDALEAAFQRAAGV